MTSSNEAVFIQFSVDKLRQLTSRILTCLDKLSTEQIWLRHHESENAVGNLVLHLCGNVRQWIGSGVGGQPDVRARDQEFGEREGPAVAELKQRLQSTVQEATRTIEGLSAERLAEFTNIQAYHITVLEAVYHVVEHFAQHTGQILFATKLFTGEDLGFYRHLSNRVPHQETTP